MLSPIRKLVLASLLLLLAMNPPAQRVQPPIVTPSASPQADWSGLRTKLDERAYQLAVFYATVSQPAKKTTAARSTVAVSYEPGSIESLILETFGTSAAVSVARCESSLNPAAKNGQYWGLFQIGVTTHAARIASMGYTAADMLTPGPNIAVAYSIYSDSGWSPWECKP